MSDDVNPLLRCLICLQAAGLLLVGFGGGWLAARADARSTSGDWSGLVVAFGVAVAVVAVGLAVVLLLALHAIGRGSSLGTVSVLLVETLLLTASLPLASATRAVVPVLVALLTGSTVWLTLREERVSSRRR